MEEQEQASAGPVHIRGKDLPGAVNVLPVGLSEVLAKRESREFNVEQNSNSVTYSTGMRSGAKVEQTFSSAKSFSSSFASSSTMSSSSGMVSTQQQLKSFGQQQQQQQQQTLVQHQQQQQQQLEDRHHGEEIQQQSLKSTLQSAITDIEEQIDGADFEAEKENYQPQYQPQKVDFEADLHHQNGVKMNPADDGVTRRFKFPHEFKGRPQSLPEFQYAPSEQLELPEVGPGTRRSQPAEEEEEPFSSHEEFRQQQASMQQVSTTTNGVYHEESSSSSHLLEQQQMISGGSNILDKVMTPSGEINTGSLKRRNPRQMFTDSAFYSPKFHPSVADQVEMAHRLSSSLYDDGNKMSKGQEMYLKRMKKSGVDSGEYEDLPHHDKVPNLKLVMNPEGKLHDWTDLPEDELPELQQIAAGGPSAEIAQNVVENLQACKGRGGELFAKRRKKADKWIIDESSIGSSAPSDFADHFVQQQFQQQKIFQMQQQQQYEEKMQRQNLEQEEARLEREQQQQEQQMIFRQQQLQKQQQSMEMRQMQAQRQQQELDLPPDFKHYSLKNRSFTPTFDTSCHNVQGINVWANKAPKPFGQSSTLPRTATPSHAKTSNYAEVPEMPKKREVEVPQVAVCPATPQVTEVEVQASERSRQEFSSSTSTTTSTSTTVKTSTEAVAQRDDLEEQKRREYEAWFKNQEREQQLLEYDCSVQYVEKQAEERVQRQEVVTSSRTEQHFQQHQLTSTNTSSTKGSAGIQDVARQGPGVATPEPKPDIPDIQSFEMKQQSLDLQQQEIQYQQKLQLQQEQDRLAREREEQERLLKQKQHEQELLRQQQEEQERLLRLEQERILKQQQEEQERLLRQQEQERLRQQQEEQERLRQQQEQERLRQQQEQERLRQQQEQERLRQQQQEQERLRQQQEQERLRQQQQEQERLRQEQERLRQQQELAYRQQQQQQEQEYLYQQQQQQQQVRYQQEQHLVQSQREYTQYSSELHHSELSMQMKTGGLVYSDLDTPDYMGSLRPTTTGAIIRAEGDVVYTQAPSYEDSDQYLSEVELRKVSTGGKKDVRQSGVFVGIFGESNALVNSSEAFDYEKHSVRSLVDHFSKTKPKEVPKAILQQQAVQTPPLSYLREQAKSKTFNYQEKGKQTQESSTVSEKKMEESKLQEMMMRRRNSLKDYLLMEFSEGTSSSAAVSSSTSASASASVQHSTAGQLVDPSTILKVDGSVAGGPRLRPGSGDDDGQGFTETAKWDNHNAIARGWRNIEDNYKPVTFRRIYGVDKQTKLIKTTASAPQLGPSHHDQQQQPDNDYEDEEPTASEAPVLDAEAEAEL